MYRIKGLMGMFFLLAVILTGSAIDAKTSKTMGVTTPGMPAPGFTLMSTSGKQVSLADFKGKYVILEWKNHLCPFVKKHYKSKNMQALQKEMIGKSVVWLSVISSAPGKQGHVSAEEANKIAITEEALPTYILLDPKGDVGRKYGAKTTPHMFVITPQGKIAYQGAIDNMPSTDLKDIPKAQNYVRVAMQSLWSGKNIQITATTPYGCSVKYE